MMRKYLFITFCVCFLSVDSLTEVKRTRLCKGFWVNIYLYHDFFDIKLLLSNGIQPDGYFVKLPVTFKSNSGDIRVAFSESNETKHSNRVYEFALGSYGNTLFEIRRKDYLHEKRDFNGNRFADYTVPTNREFNVEFSVSRSGVVHIKEFGSGLKLSFVDQLPVINVKYVSFAGFEGAATGVEFDCAYLSATGNDSTTDEQNDSETQADNDDTTNAV